MNTGTYRAQALAEQKALNWLEAAKLWDLAVSVYPNPHGDLAKRDIELMTNRARTCRAMAAE